VRCEAVSRLQVDIVSVARAMSLIQQDARVCRRAVLVRAIREREVSAVPRVGAHMAWPLPADGPCRALEQPRRRPRRQGVDVIPQRRSEAPAGRAR